MFKNKATANVALLFTFISVAVASVAVVKNYSKRCISDYFLAKRNLQG